MKIDIKNNKLIINGNKIDDTKQYIKDLYVDLFNTIIYLGNMKKDLDLCSNEEGYNIVYPNIEKTQDNGETVIVREWRGKSIYEETYRKLTKYLDNFDGIEN